MGEEGEDGSFLGSLGFFGRQKQMGPKTASCWAEGLGTFEVWSTVGSLGLQVRLCFFPTLTSRTQAQQEVSVDTVSAFRFRAQRFRAWSLGLSP